MEESNLFNLDKFQLPMETKRQLETKMRERDFVHACVCDIIYRESECMREVNR